jgi:hypothetical protein
MKCRDPAYDGPSHPAQDLLGLWQASARLDSPAGAQLSNVLLSRVLDSRPPISEAGPLADPHKLGLWAGLKWV